jgi:hypothetical protein
MSALVFKGSKEETVPDPDFNEAPREQRKS